MGRVVRPAAEEKQRKRRGENDKEREEMKKGEKDEGEQHNAIRDAMLPNERAQIGRAHV